MLLQDDKLPDARKAFEALNEAHRRLREPGTLVSMGLYRRHLGTSDRVPDLEAFICTVEAQWLMLGPQCYCQLPPCTCASLARWNISSADMYAHETLEVEVRPAFSLNRITSLHSTPFAIGAGAGEAGGCSAGAAAEAGSRSQPGGAAGAERAAEAGGAGTEQTGGGQPDVDHKFTEAGSFGVGKHGAVCPRHGPSHCFAE